MQTVTVSLKDKSYPVWVGTHLLDEAGALLQNEGLGGKVLLVSSDRVYNLYGDRVKKSLERAGLGVTAAQVPDGEEYKSLESAQKLYTAAIQAGLDRGSLVVALGGGVIGDLAGFVAATFMRGVALVGIPTTLLSQVDSSIGGKVGVNHPLGKNLIGAFHQPRAVICDLFALKTLEPRQLLNGLVEVIKHGIIGDRKLLRLMEESPEQAVAGDLSILKECVIRSLLLKGRIVAQDERESSLRAVLNFGHTIGHGIEQAAGYGTYTHGEAVAIGMRGALEISHQLGILEGKVKDRLIRLMQSYSLPMSAPDCDPDQVLSAMTRDKKNRAGRLRFVLLQDVERPVLRDDVPAELVQSVLTNLTAR